MIASNEISLTYRESTIRIVNQQQTVVIDWQSQRDGSVGHLQVTKANWADGEIVRLVMETIDRCYKQHRRSQNQRQS